MFFLQQTILLMHTHSNKQAINLSFYKFTIKKIKTHNLQGCSRLRGLLGAHMGAFPRDDVAIKARKQLHKLN